MYKEGIKEYVDLLNEGKETINDTYLVERRI